jgi:CheY-specific phosphatase CheX
MNATPPPISQLSVWLISSVHNVFDTMFQLSAEQLAPETIQIPAEEAVAVSIGFNGQVSVDVHIYAERAAALQLASIVLDMPASELDQPTMGDVMGELGNMVVGAVKSNVSDLGINCTMTIPSVSFGPDCKAPMVPPASGATLGFGFNGGKCLIEMVLKPAA